MAERRGNPPPTGILSRQVTLAALTLAGLIVQRLPLPWGLVAIAFLVPAAVVGVRLVASLRRAGVRGLTMAGAVLTVAVIAFSLFLSLATAAFYPVAASYQRCQRAAITESAVQDCRQDLTRRTETMFGLTPSSSN